MLLRWASTTYPEHGNITDFARPEDTQAGQPPWTSPGWCLLQEQLDFTNTSDLFLRCILDRLQVLLYKEEDVIDQIFRTLTSKMLLLSEDPSGNSDSNIDTTF